MYQYAAYSVQASERSAHQQWIVEFKRCTMHKEVVGSRSPDLPKSIPQKQKSEKEMVPFWREAGLGGFQV
jgi:hypothetical protein